jgi:hypothetical protein
LVALEEPNVPKARGYVDRFSLSGLFGVGDHSSTSGGRMGRRAKLDKCLFRSAIKGQTVHEAELESRHLQHKAV